MDVYPKESRKYQEEFVDRIEIRDTSEYVSRIVQVSGHTIMIVKVENTHDRPIIAQVYGNTDDSYDGAMKIGYRFVADYSPDGTVRACSRTFVPERAGYLPYVFLKLWSKEAPTGGNVSIKILRHR